MGRFSKELYDRNVIVKSAYLFTEKYYIHIDVDQEAYIIEFTSKDGNTADDIDQLYENELIAEQTRVIVNNKTKNLRELIAARALSSTIVDIEQKDDINDGREAQKFSASDILQDWFSDNE